MGTIKNSIAVEDGAILLLEERLDEAFGEIDPLDEANIAEKMCQKINFLYKICRGAEGVFTRISCDLMDVVTSAPSDLWLPELTHSSLEEYRLRTRVMHELLRKHSENRHTVLDLGSGTCNTLVRLTKFDDERKLLGLEKDPDVAYCALRFLRNMRLDQIRILMGDLLEIPLQDSSCDLVTILNCLKFLTEDQIKTCMKETYRVLIPEGELLIDDTMALLHRIDLTKTLSDIGFVDVETIDLSQLVSVKPELFLCATKVKHHGTARS